MNSKFFDESGVPGQLRLFAINRIFTIENLFEDTWKSESETMKAAIAEDFSKWIVNNPEFKDQIQVHEANKNLILQKYINKGKSNIQEKKNILPDEPVTIKRNERGNA
jgi:hypothetical protein